MVFGARVKGDRKAYRAFAGKSGNNHPKWYGTELILNQPDKHFPADFKIQYHEKKVGHQEIKTEVSLWKNMLFKGSRDFNSIEFPCTLIRIESFRKNGKSAYEKPLWVAFYGKLRDERFPFELVKLYSNRFKIEHFFKFIKQNMLMNDFQTPEIKHEESCAAFSNLHTFSSTGLRIWLKSIFTLGKSIFQKNRSMLTYRLKKFSNISSIYTKAFQTIMPN